MLRTHAYKRIVEVMQSRRATGLVFGSERSNLQDLPVELVVKILVQLSIRDLLEWQLVSRHFRAVIQSSVTLQYIITCNRCDILVEPSSVLRNRKDQIHGIRAWSEAWKTVTWKLEITNASEDAFSDYSPSTTRCTKKPVIDCREPYVPSGYDYDVDNDVLITSEVGVNNETIQLYALTLSSKQPHPSRSPTAQDMILINTETTDSDADHLSISVSGSFILSYGLYTEYPLGDGFVTEVWVHNWESGELLMNFWSEQSSNLQFNDHVFLDDRYLLLTIQGSSPFLIAIFDCYAVDADSCSLEDALEEAVLILELPDIFVDAECVFLGVKCQQRRKSLPYGYRNANFTPANSSPVIHIDLPLQQGGRKRIYEVLIPNETIFSRIGKTRRVVPWDEWGEEVRVFEGIDRHNKPAVSGSRYAARELDPTSGRHHLAIYDFCPLSTMLRELVDDQHADVVIKPTLVEDDNVFIDAILCKAPYRRVKTDVVLEDDEVPSINEDDITIWKVSPGQGPSFPRLTRSRVFCF